MIKLTIENLASILFMMGKIGLNISLKSKNIFSSKIILSFRQTNSHVKKFGFANQLIR